MEVRYDVVFFAHGTNETDRYLPLMVSLKDKGVKPLLFYQNYKASDGLSSFHKAIIKRFCLDVKDYSEVYNRHFVLQFLSIIINCLPVCLFKRKMIGFRSKLLAYAIDRENIRIFLKSIGHSVNIFDFIEINKDTKYPYGSYFIKDISSNMGIRNIALPHGTSLYVADHLYPKNINLDFDKIFVSDHRYKEYMKASCVKAGTEVTALGDPRFDTGWKNVLKKVALRNNILSRLRIGHYNKVILYLCPNLEQIKLDKTKYENLKDVARAVMGIEDAVFLVKPHPRYRNERLIRKAMKELGFNHYRILSDDPAICYADIVDYVISSATSAFFDFLPVYRKKVLIYDNFMEEAGVKNLFKEYLDPFGQFFRDCQSLSEYLSRQTDISDNDDQLSEEDLGFESRMIAGGGSPEKIVENYCQYFIKELEKVDG